MQICSFFSSFGRIRNRKKSYPATNRQKKIFLKVPWWILWSETSGGVQGKHQGDLVVQQCQVDPPSFQVHFLSKRSCQFLLSKLVIWKWTRPFWNTVPCLIQSCPFLQKKKKLSRKVYSHFLSIIFFFIKNAGKECL